VEQWKLGRANVDDGALLIIAKNDRAWRIEGGYGLEGVLTEATSRRIIDELIVPSFRRGDCYGGV
ncbi:TPM domain-containing protein, partial [Burkholderia pseudomallei]|uniref:TPM domain-containing protein n=1 Tax=Burkholderia pseudomallei TaxID=28450 RepID=UPI000CCE7332